MKRLTLFLFLFLPTLSGIEQRMENVFANEYNAWVKLRAATTPGTINAAEVLQWQKVKAAWRKVEKTIDREYRGY